MNRHDFPFVIAQFDGTHIVDAVVFGERNSGTNYVSELLRRNFAKLTNMASDKIERFGFRYGWKHGFATMVSAPRNALCVIVVRHPETWLRSMHQRPWHSTSAVRHKSFSDFIRSEWTSCIDEQNFGVLKDDFRWLSELQYDRHPLSGERFSNIIALRNAKITSFFGNRNRFLNFLVVRLEDVQDNPSSFIHEVGKLYTLEVNSEFLDIHQRRGKDLDGKFSRTRYRELKAEDKKFVWQQLDETQEGLTGYFPL